MSAETPADKSVYIRKLDAASDPYGHPHFDRFFRMFPEIRGTADATAAQLAEYCEVAGL